MTKVKTKSTSSIASDVSRLLYGDKIRDARKAANLSQSQLAKAIGVSDRAISSYEQNRNTPPIDKLRRIAAQTKYSLQFFVGEADPLISVQRIMAIIEEDLVEIKQLLKKQ